MGIKLFRKKFYQAAIGCFNRSGDEELKVRSFAYQHADEAANLMSDAESCFFAATHNRTLKKFERSQRRTEGKQKKIEAFREFELAGQYFEQIGLNKNAAQCYYTCKQFAKAADLFFQNKMYAQAAECYMTI